MTERIMADSETLFKQAPMTAKSYMIDAVIAIDKWFEEEGYAKNHPELVAAFMEACALDLGSAIIARAIETLADEIGKDRS
jgi:hypothetical protein